MTEDLNIDESLKYLDDVLRYLIHNTSDYSVTFNSFYAYKFGRNFEKDNKEFKIGMVRTLNNDFDNFSISDNTKAQAEKLIQALYFLKSKNLVYIDTSWNIKITFDGIIEYGKGGFVAKLKEERYKTFLDSFNVYVTIAISLASLLVGALVVHYS
ncbi:hypothetical protein [Algibacter pectinivorans]|uniref:Uncharacterized protein n=1 Tax=Algibacter pectinivorans TaxID=870482 RepID=A0A1I1S5C9_9FLAO|nr:hypothetical protein [Algibacter pectinivorans]SFD41706.1 hypothetical protein SAMN04487987_11327 [Algibacter pectinivorans]